MNEITAATPTILTPPEIITAVPKEKTVDMVPLKPDYQEKIDTQVSNYVEQLMSSDLQSEAFRSKADSAFRLGKQEISVAASLMTGRFLERNFVGIEDSKSFKAIQEMRNVMDELNPGKQGDLMMPNKLFGIIPFGNKLKAYFRKYQSAGAQMQVLMTQIAAARDDMQRDSAEIELTKAKLYEAMTKLKGAIYFAQQLDAQLYSKIAELKITDPLRSAALEQEVLFYARQNVTDMLMQLSVCVNGYLSMDVLKKTAREMVNGCDRVVTTGMSALAIAQTVARATGNQIQVMEMLSSTSNVIGDLITQSSKQLGVHVEKTAEFASNPLVGVEKIQEMFNNTFAAMDSMDKYRSSAIEAMGKNNQTMKSLIEKSETYVERANQIKTIQMSSNENLVAM